VSEQDESLEVIADGNESSVGDELGDAGKTGTGGGNWIDPDTDP
jgi:hypothetical protein